MSVVLSALAVAAITGILVAAFVTRNEGLLITGSAPFIYVFTWFLLVVGWITGVVDVVPAPGASLQSVQFLLPPLGVTLVYIAWLSVLFCSRRLDRRTPNGLRARRLLQLVLAGVVAAAFVGLQMFLEMLPGASGAHKSYLEVIVAITCMASVSVLTLLKDKNVEMTLLCLFLALMATIPVVVVARTAVVTVLRVFYSTLRGVVG
jgi:hypothetical protein